MNKQTKSFDEKIMRQIFRMARRKMGISSPNPLVASIIVKNGQIVGKGTHNIVGTPHAEPLAIKNAGSKARDATLYVNLEPCTHWGKNPPCTEAIIKAGLKKVVYSVTDPNPLVRKTSAYEILTKAGIEVESGLLEQEGILLNEEFIKNQKFKKPLVTLKAGMSLDGKIALASGQSKYITGASALKEVHKIRNTINGILIGSGTLEADDPSLSVRYGLKQKSRPHPTRIILDSQLKIDLTKKMFQVPDAKTIVVTKSKWADSEKIRTFEDNITFIFFDSLHQPLFWDQLLNKLYEHGITNVLIEGGSKIFTSAVEAGVVDKILFFYAPRLLMGLNSISVFGGEGVKNLEQALILRDMKVKQLDPDIMISGYLNHPFDW